MSGALYDTRLHVTVHMPTRTFAVCAYYGFCGVSTDASERAIIPIPPSPHILPGNWQCASVYTDQYITTYMHKERRERERAAHRVYV